MPPPAVNEAAAAAAPLAAMPLSSADHNNSSNSNFADAFLVDWQTATTRVDRGRQLMGLLSNYVEERAALEALYSERMRALANKLSPAATESSGVKKTMSAIQHECSKRANHAAELASVLKADILQGAVASTVANHQTVLRHISADALTLTASLETARSEFADAEREVASTGRQCYQLARAALQSEQWSCGTHSRMTVRWLTRLRDLQQQHAWYTRMARNYNEAVTVYQRQMKVILESLQDMDRKRLSCLKDTLMRLLVFDLSAMRNVLYDTEQTVRVVEALDPDSDLLEFIQREMVSRASFASTPLPSEQLQLLQATTATPKHWAEICVSPSAIAIAPPTTATLKSGKAAESAVDAAKNLLARTPFSAVVQSAVAGLGYTTQDPLSSSVGPVGESQFGGGTEAAAGGYFYQLSDTSTPQDVLHWLGYTAGAKATDQSSTVVAKVDTAPPNDFDDLLSLIWNFTSVMSRDVHPLVHKAKGLLNTPHQRCLFMKALRQKNDREQYQLPTMDSIHILAKLMASCLESCAEQNDIPNIRDGLILVQRFYALGGQDDDPYKKHSTWTWPREEEANDTVATEQPQQEQAVVPWFLHRAVYHLPLWSQVSVWEETLIYSICFEQQIEILQDAEKAIRRAVQKVALSEPVEAYTAFPALSRGFIERFPLCMIAFGIPADATKALVTRVLDRHNLTAPYRQLLSASSNAATPLPSPNDTPTVLPFAPPHQPLLSAIRESSPEQSSSAQTLHTSKKVLDEPSAAAAAAPSTKSEANSHRSPDENDCGSREEPIATS